MDSLDVSKTLSSLIALSAAYAIAFLIGWDREQETRGAGLRTFPIVAIASCGLILLSRNVLGGSEEAHGRMLQGLITGIGFIGAGAILKEERTVHGTSTAASVWNIGVVGAAVGYGLYDIALMLGLINLVTLRLLLPLKKELQPKKHDR
jgi:putative Mg2+ transporter-C (MgtC) family protein